MSNNIEKAMEEMLSQVDKKHFFPALRASYLCQAKCTETSKDRHQLQNCLGSCGQTVEKMQAAIDGHLQDFQQRLSRCVMHCQDEARDSLPVNPSQQNIAQAQTRATKCVDACADDFVKKIPKLKSEIESRIK